MALPAPRAAPGAAARGRARARLRAASVFHFACDGDLSPGRGRDSASSLHLCLVGLVASGRTLAATGLVLGYLVGVHVPALVAALVEVHDAHGVLSVLGLSALLALAAPRATIEASAFGADAYDPRSMRALRFDAHVQRVVAAHAVVPAVAGARDAAADSDG